MEKIIKEKMRLLLERFRKGHCVIQESQEVLFWKGDLKLLEGREETSLMGALKGAFQAEGIYGGRTGTKKLGVTEELEGQGGQNTRVKGIGYWDEVESSTAPWRLYERVDLVVINYNRKFLEDFK